MVMEKVLAIFRCPACGGALELKDAKKNGEQVLEGSLRCPACGVDYPVVDGIPLVCPT